MALNASRFPSGNFADFMVINRSLGCWMIVAFIAVMDFAKWPNDERMHHYQQGRTSITGLVLKLREIIETGRLVVVVMTRLVLLLDLQG